MKKTQGITLISIIITIIIMLILVAVTITAVINSGLIGKTQDTGSDMKTAYEDESKINNVTIGEQTYSSLQEYVDEGNVVLEPGLYQTGTRTLIKSWDKLEEDGALDIEEDGTLKIIDINLEGDLRISEKVTKLEQYRYL